MADRLISPPELKSRFGIHYDRTSLWRLEREGRFPKRLRLTERRVAWAESEILAYIEQLKSERSKHSDKKLIAAPGY